MGQGAAMAMPGVLAEIIRHLWQYGVPVVAWAVDRDRIALCCAGGVVGWIAASDLSLAPPLVAARLAGELPRRSVIETPASPSMLPEITMTTLAWWEFLRYMVATQERRV